MRNWVRREGPDHTRRIRHTVQLAFLVLNIWIGLQFYLFVSHYEGSGWGPVARPAGVEGWLPIAGMMSTRYWLLTGGIPVIHPAAMFLFLAFVAMSLLLRKAFCGWLCPIGTLSEYLWRCGQDTFRRTFSLTRWLDIPLRGLKYILMALFVYAVASMTSDDLRAFLYSPYGVVADVQMLNFFRYLSVGGAVTLGILLIGSLFVKNVWCRYLCPYGALMGIAALLSPLRIRRNPEACIDCAKCAKACPSHLPVDRLVQVRSAECLGCMECVSVCPAEGALAMKVAPVNRRAPAWAVAAAVVVIFSSVVGFARLSGHWDSPIPDAMYQRLIPRAREFGHP